MCAKIETMNAGTPSSTCLDLVKRFEGFRAEPLALGDGRWLVGHGHVRAGAPLQPVGETEAAFLLKEDLEEISQVLRRVAPDAFTQNQFDALASFGFSIGADALETSDVLRLAAQGYWTQAGAAMEAWRLSGASGVAADALVRRRAAEKALLLAEENPEPAPSAVLRPMRETPEAGDHDAPLPPPRKPQQSDALGLAALGVLGLLLIAMGVTGADDDNGMAYFVFAAPGLVGVAMSVYYLLKKTVEAV